MRQGPFKAWTDCVKHDRAGVLATVLESDSEAAVGVGSRLFISENGRLVGSLGDRDLDDKVAALAREKLALIDPKSETDTFDLHGRSVTVFVDVHVPAAELIIFGAGHDAVPVAAIARQCGFRVTVIDPREAFATAERFPGARIILARPEEWEESVRPDRRTFIVIMNHHLERDRVCLKFSLQSAAPYVGLLGPKKRRLRLLDSLRERGVTFSEEQLSRMYNPVGLDIGAEGPEEIAVSILSEIIALKHGSSGGHLRMRTDTPSVQARAETR